MLIHVAEDFMLHTLLRGNLNSKYIEKVMFSKTMKSSFLVSNSNFSGLQTVIYLVLPPKEGLFQSKQGTFGFQVYIYIYIYIYMFF